MPMLIIFGGLPGTGRTAIAQQLARAFAHRRKPEMSTFLDEC